MKIKNLSIFIDRGLYGLDKDKTPNQLYNYTYLDYNGDLIQPISDLMPHTNIRVDSSIERGLIFRTLILLNKKRDLLNKLDNDSIVELELDTESTSIPILSKLLFFWTPNQKNMTDSKWELATLRNARNLYLSVFGRVEKVIKKAFRF